MSNSHIENTLFDEPSLYDPITGQILKTKGLIFVQLIGYIRSHNLTHNGIMSFFGLTSEKATYLAQMNSAHFTIDELLPLLEKTKPIEHLPMIEA